MEDEERLKAEINTMIKQKNYHWILLAKHLFGECSEDESKKLQNFLIHNPDFNAIADVLNNFGHTPAVKNTDTPELLWDRHVHRMNRKNILQQIKINAQTTGQAKTKSRYTKLC